MFANHRSRRGSTRRRDDAELTQRVFHRGLAGAEPVVAQEIGEQVPQPKDENADQETVDYRAVPDPSPAPMTWMQRLKRVFAIDVETCPKCGGTLRVIACIEDPDVIATILGHIRARDEAKPAQPRAPPLRAGHPDPTR